LKSKSDKPRGFVLYTQDYFGDSELRRMPAEIRIVWVEAFFLMSESPRRGVLLHQDGTAYTPSEMVPVIAGGITLAAVERAFHWVVINRIADKERGTGALISRKMVRDEVRRKTGEKFGKKGGNPALKHHPKSNETPSVNDTNDNDNSSTLKGRVKPEGGYPSGYTTDPDPDPDPVSFSNPVDNSLTDKLAGAEKRTSRKPDPAFEIFAQKHETATTVPYAHKQADFVQLAKLRSDVLKIGTREIPDGWESAVDHFFATPRAKYTLADLCTNYATFKNSPLNEYNRPVNHPAVGGSNGRYESPAAARAKRNADAKAIVLARLHAADSADPAERPAAGSPGALPESARRS